MGRNSRVKKLRRAQRQHSLNEAWGYFTSRHFLRQIRRMMLDAGAAHNSCVAACKVYCQIAETVGLDARPLTVETSVFNPVFAEFIKQHGLDPSEEQMREMGEQGGRYVVLGARDEGDEGDEGETPSESNWSGHLVAILSANGRRPVVVDLTIDQANRPDKDILIPDPIVFEAPPGFVDGVGVATGYCVTPAGLNAMVYRAFPEDISFESSPEWQLDYAARAHDKIEFEESSDG